MSTEDADLTSFADATGQDPEGGDSGHTQPEGARYSRSWVDGDLGDETPADAGCCRRCGTAVDDLVHGQVEDHVRRVYADDYNRVSACPNCPDIDQETVASAIAASSSTSEQARAVSLAERYKREVGDVR